MLSSVARVPHTTHRQWRVDDELEGWMIRRDLAPLPLVEMMMKTKAMMNDV